MSLFDLIPEDSGIDVGQMKAFLEEYGPKVAISKLIGEDGVRMTPADIRVMLKTMQTVIIALLITLRAIKEDIEEHGYVVNGTPTCETCAATLERLEGL